MAQVVNATVASTNYNIADLLLAINSKEPIHVQSVTFQAVIGNANDVLIGGADMTDSSYGIRLTAGSSVTINSGSGSNRLHLAQFYLRGLTGANLKLAVLQVVC